MIPTIQLVRTSDTARMPSKAHPSDSGWDVYSASIYTIQPGQRALIDTGWKIHPGEGWEVQVRPRSGLALKKGITVLNTPGTVDAMYQDSLGVILLNTSNEPVLIDLEDRIAQLVVQPVYKADFVEVPSFVVLSDRGDKGFGSSGQ